MSDEESFVILGTSPTPSMVSINSLPMASSPSPVAVKEAIASATADSPLKRVDKNTNIVQSQLTNSTSSESGQYSIVPNINVFNKPKLTNGTSVESLFADCASTSSSKIQISSRHQSSSSSSGDDKQESRVHASSPSNRMATSTYGSHVNQGKPESLAASFILGEVNSDVLKSSVYSQFPSICSMGACPEDISKLQNLLMEYVELKKTLLNTNITMKQLYDQTQKWKADVKAMETDRRVEIAKLRNENLELRRDLEMKVEQVKINEEARHKEHEEFIKSLSEKTSQIENMREQIQKLEQIQLASFEFIPKSGNEQLANKFNDASGAATTEYVTTAEHQRIVKDFERQMSAIVAENLELKDMQQQYIDEINCLKVNLVAAEEFQKKAEEDIKFLKASDEEKSEMFSRFEAERKTLRIDLDVLTQQLEIYSRDFKTEQECRENLANEKDQLLADLRELQRKNQELIQEAQKNYEEHTRHVMTATGAVPKTRSQPSPSPRPNIYSPENIFNCPLCGKIFKTLCILQAHVNECLDGN